MQGMCVKVMELVCLFRTICTPDELLSMWKDTVSMLFRLKWCHEM